MYDIDELKIKVPGPVREILDTLKENGFEAYIVGGCVRDAILGLEPKDYDITTSALPEQVKSLFSNTVDTGIQHGTVMVVRHGVGYEVTTYRIDGEYKDGRHPEQVTFTRSLAEDLKRRDFTINAFAYDPEKGLVDLFDGLGDLNDRLIRCVGDPNARFTEDALRIMRAVRFSAQLSFKIETVTLAAIGKHVQNLKNVSMERIRVEFEKTLLSAHPEKINQYAALGMAEFIVPEAHLSAKCFHAEDAELYQAVKEDDPLIKELRLAVFLRRLTAEEASKVLRRMKYDNKTIYKVSGIIKSQDRTILPEKKDVKLAMHEMGQDIFEAQLSFQEILRSANMDKLREIEQQIIADQEPYEIAQLCINGNDLIEAGIPKGTQIGDCLNALLQKVIEDPQLNEKETLLKMAIEKGETMDYREMYESWLNDPAIDEETKAELRSIKNDDAEIKDRFFQELEFGTAGLRGVIGAGTNRMNKYTVAKATQGLSDYIHLSGCNDPAVAIACDSRRMSPEFVDITAAVLNANGIKAYVFESLRPTPELSFAVRHLNCIAGVNITASHNPAEYNGYKAYWADGAQVTPPHDKGIMECVNKVTNFSSPKMMEKAEAIQKGLYITIGEEVDEAYMQEVAKQVKEPEIMAASAKDVTVVYTPLHGAGIMIVPKLLKRFGFTDFTVVPEQEKPDGNFPTVEFPNPEMPAAFALADQLGREKNADIIIATDPDADRIGMHVKDKNGEYHEIGGNVIGCLICEYELARRKAKGDLPEDGYVVRSIVSSQLFDAIAKSYGVEVRAVLTGFKNIGAEILKSEESGKGTYLFGFEESYGYLVGTYARDKDACVAALKLCEMCTFYKANGKTLWDAVEELYEKYGFHMEKTISITKKGIDGMQAIAKTMEDMRNDPPKELGGFPVESVLDYEKPETTGLPKSNVLYFELPDAWVCVRPSGTEPKIKYYVGVKADDMKKAADMVAALEKGIMQKE